jgi:hypothetical protein
LHNDKVGIVDIELNGLEKGMNLFGVSAFPLEHVLGRVWKHNLKIL